MIHHEVVELFESYDKLMFVVNQGSFFLKNELYIRNKAENKIF